MLTKDDGEHAVPEEWRVKFRQIADAFVAGDFELRDHAIAGVAPIDPDKAEHIAANVEVYGDSLSPLDDETWKRSIYTWAHDHWEFIVDLSMKHEKVGDLAIHARLFDRSEAPLEVYLVYVP